MSLTFPLTRAQPPNLARAEAARDTGFVAVDTAAEEEDDGDAVLAKCESIAERLRSAATGGAAAAWRQGQLGGSESAFVTLEQARHAPAEPLPRCSGPQLLHRAQLLLCSGAKRLPRPGCTPDRHAAFLCLHRSLRRAEAPANISNSIRLRASTSCCSWLARALAGPFWRVSLSLSCSTHRVGGHHLHASFALLAVMCHGSSHVAFAPACRRDGTGQNGTAHLLSWCALLVLRHHRCM